MLRSCVTVAGFLILSMAVSAATGLVRSTQDLCGTAPCIQIGTFNIKYLGTDSEIVRTDAQVGEIARMIAVDLDLEVVVLEEINASSEDFRVLVDSLGAAGYRLHAGQSGGTQNVVLAYDDDEVDLISHDGAAVSELPARTFIDMGGPCKDDVRLPLAGHFRAGQFDFLLVGVHLKSGRRPAGAKADCPDRIRRSQARELARLAEEAAERFGEADLIVAGDFNAFESHFSLNALDQIGLIALTTADRRSFQSGVDSYVAPGFPGIIDHLMIRESQTREWVLRSTMVFKVPSAQLSRYLSVISDHAPVWASFTTNNDPD